MIVLPELVLISSSEDTNLNYNQENKNMFHKNTVSLTFGNTNSWKCICVDVTNVSK